jgi:DNA-binding transcriptional LysR family regulator
VQGRLIVNDNNLAIRAAIEGTGLLQLSPRYVASELAARRVSTVLDRWAPPPVDGLFLYYPSRRQIRPALKAFVDFLRRR